MIPVASGARIWIATGHADMRKGMQGLALLVQEGLGRDPFAGDLYIFRGRRGDTPGPWAVHLAIGHGRCGIDLCGADGLYAGRDRLAKSAADLAAEECLAERNKTWSRM